MTKKKRCEQHDGDVSLLAIDQYMRLVRQIPRLSSEEEIGLIQWVEQGRAEQGQPLADEHLLERARLARERLVLGYQPFVIYIAKKYRRSSSSMELLDLISEGNLGLLRALAYHRSGEGYSLLTLVSRCVRQAIQAGLYSRESLVRLPKDVACEVEWLRQEQRQLEDYLGCEPTVEQLAEQMKLSVRQVQDLLQWSARQQVSSIEAIVGHSEEDEFRFLRWLEPSLSDDQARQDVLSQAVRQAVEALPPRQRQATQLRYGLDGQAQWRDWQEVGERLGLCAKSAAALEYVGRRRLRLSLAWLYEEGRDGEVA